MVLQIKPKIFENCLNFTIFYKTLFGERLKRNNEILRYIITRRTKF